MIRLYLAAGVFGVFIFLCVFSYWAWQRIDSLKDDLANARAAIERHKENEVVTNEYVQSLNAINDRYIARGVYLMSCERATAEGSDGEGVTPRFGNPYPAISAYQARCERIAEKLNKLQESVKEN